MDGGSTEYRCVVMMCEVSVVMSSISCSTVDCNSMFRPRRSSSGTKLCVWGVGVGGDC